MLPTQRYIRYIVRRRGFKKRLRKMKSHSLLRHFFEMLLMLAGLIVLHTLAMMHFEKMAFPDALWLSLTTATTVGYGDYSAGTFGGRAATIILLYIGGIALLAQAAGVYFEFRQERREKMLNGRWRWHMREHILFINEPSHHADLYFEQAVRQLRQASSREAALPVLLAGARFPQGLPEELRALDIAHYYAPRIDDRVLLETDARNAAVIVLMAKDNNDAVSDAVNFDLVCRLRAAGCPARIICETVLPENRRRLLDAGADSVLRPIRIYPEMLARAIVSPGSEKIIENLFSSDGEECIRLDIPVSGLWRDIAVRCMEADLGLAVAYVDMHGETRTAPSAGDFAEARALFLIRNMACRNGGVNPQDALAEFRPRDAA